MSSKTIKITVEVDNKLIEVYEYVLEENGDMYSNFWDVISNFKDKIQSTWNWNKFFKT